MLSEPIAVTLLVTKVLDTLERTAYVASPENICWASALGVSDLLAKALTAAEPKESV